jgi:hypothetical protein
LEHYYHFLAVIVPAPGRAASLVRGFSKEHRQALKCGVSGYDFRLQFTSSAMEEEYMKSRLEKIY